VGGSMGLKEDFLTRLKKYEVAPFLFVGSGISQRYLGLENWEGLLKELCKPVGRSYNYYKACGNSNLPSVSEEIAKDLHHLWWNSKEYMNLQNSYIDSLKTKHSPFKIEISRYIEKKSQTLEKGLQSLPKNLIEEIKELKKATIQGVITTNWDCLMEHIFSEFRVYIGQDQLIDSSPRYFEEIFKIHGCRTQPNSLVATETDYQIFRKKNPYLVAKLLTMFMEHPVIFLGYSLNDPNISEILRSIISCLTSKNINQFMERLIFVQWRKNHSGYEIKNINIVVDNFNIPVLNIKTHEFLPLYQALASLKRKFPLSFIRFMEEQKYRLKRKGDKNKIIGFDKEMDLKEAEIVVLVQGTIKDIKDMGYRGILREDLFKDIIFDNFKFDAKKIVKYRLPELLKRAKFVPIFKYLKKGGYLDINGELQEKYTKGRYLLNFRLNNAASVTKDYFKNRSFAKANEERIKECQSIEDIANMFSGRKNGKHLTVMSIPLLDVAEISVDEILNHIKEYLKYLKKDYKFDLTWVNVKKKGGLGTYRKTHLYKLICFYDWLCSKQDHH
jgi:hypothetical protein